MSISNEKYFKVIEFYMKIGNKSKQVYSNKNPYYQAAAFLVGNGLITDDKMSDTKVYCEACKLTKKGQEVLAYIQTIIAKDQFLN